MTEEATSAPPTWTLDQWVDFWRYQIGINVIPADTKNKAIYEKWSEWQDKHIPEQLHNQWKSKNKFSNGMAVILGRVWHNKQKSDLYLNGIDADNLKAIEEICTYNGKTVSIRDLAKWTLVEQHPDDINRAHIYIYSKHSKHGTMFCCPSPHKNGHSYQILGTLEPVIADDFEKHIDDICKKHGINYLANGNGNGSNDKSSSHLIPIEDLFKPDTKIYEGHNRHEALLRAIESLISRNKGIVDLEDIRQLAAKWNSVHCILPLDNKEFEKQWKSASRFIAKNGNGNGQAHNGNSNTKEQDDEQHLPKSKEFTVFKYSQDISLAEEITVHICSTIHLWNNLIF